MVALFAMIDSSESQSKVCPLSSEACTTHACSAPPGDRSVLCRRGSPCLPSGGVGRPGQSPVNLCAVPPRLAVSTIAATRPEGTLGIWRRLALQCISRVGSLHSGHLATSRSTVAAKLRMRTWTLLLKKVAVRPSAHPLATLWPSPRPEIGRRLAGDWPGGSDARRRGRHGRLLVSAAGRRAYLVHSPTSEASWARREELLDLLERAASGLWHDNCQPDASSERAASIQPECAWRRHRGLRREPEPRLSRDGWEAGVVLGAGGEGTWPWGVVAVGCGGRGCPIEPWPH